MTEVDNREELVRDAIRWHEYGSQDERRRKAIPAFDSLMEELNHMRTAWMDEAEEARELKRELALATNSTGGWREYVLSKHSGDATCPAAAAAREVVEAARALRLRWSENEGVLSLADWGRVDSALVAFSHYDEVTR